MLIKHTKPNSVSANELKDGGVEWQDLSPTLQALLTGATIPVGWRDMHGQIEVRGSGGSDPTWSRIGASPFFAYKFDVGDECWIDYHVDHDYMPNGEAYFHVHWIADSTDTVTPVRFQVDIAVAKGHQQGSGSVFPFGSLPYKDQAVFLQQASAGRFMHMVIEMDQTMLRDKIESDSLIAIRLSRVAAPGGDLTAPVFVKRCDLHYQCSHYNTPKKAPPFY